MNAVERDIEKIADCIRRLVFANREAVMLGTFADDPWDTTRETAITGEGAENTLVVLMQQLVCARLDHFDRQTEDLLSEVLL